MPLSIAFIGAGMMGSAIAIGLVKSSVAAISKINDGNDENSEENGMLFDRFLFCDPSVQSLKAIKKTLLSIISPSSHDGKSEKISSNTSGGVKIEIKTSTNNDEAHNYDVIIFAVKPQYCKPMMNKLGPKLTKRNLVISIMAGVTIRTIRRETSSFFGIGDFCKSGGEMDNEFRIIRCMPNAPLLVLLGTVAFVTENFTERMISNARRTHSVEPRGDKESVIGLEDLKRLTVEVEKDPRLAELKEQGRKDAEIAMRMFSPISGYVVRLDTEHQLDLITPISGSSPAFVSLLVDALADAGVLIGLPRKLSEQLAASTVYGSGKMMLSLPANYNKPSSSSSLSKSRKGNNGANGVGLGAKPLEHPLLLRDAVCSPGGCSIAGVYALEKNNFRAAVIDAVVKTAEKLAELSKL